jgi:hypothetical protein
LCPSVATTPGRYNATEQLVLPAGGAGEADLRRGDELQWGRWRNLAVAAESYGGGAVGKWRARGGNFRRCVFAWVPRDAALCSRRVTFGIRIVQKAARPNFFFAVPPRIARLLEG